MLPTVVVGPNSRRSQLRSRYLKLLALLAALMLVAAACGGDTDGNGNGGGGGGATSDVKVGLALDVGPIQDRSFNEAAFRGVNKAIDDGLIAEDNLQLLEANQSGSNRDDNVLNLADAGFDLIVANGYTFSEGVAEIAPDYPDQFFAVTDGFSTTLPGGKNASNMTDLTFKEEEGSFLVGAAAAMKTETGTIGFLGGQAGTGLIEKFQAGYTAGAEAVNPDIEVLVEYIGDSVQAFTDPTKGEALAAKMYDAGADVVFHAAGQSGVGLFKAAVTADKLAIGVDSDQSLTASPEEQGLILTSMLKRVDVAVYDTIQQVVDGNFQSGFQVFGLAEDGIDYAVNEFNDSPELLSEDVQAKLDEFKQQILDGEIKVPTKP
jgi:basic membrane protein A and related proteins